MREKLLTLFASMGIFVGCLPVSFFVTFLLSPLWSWIEESWKIESIGHSGPSEWCFWTIYALFVVPLTAAFWIHRRRRSASV